jgi:hypothetical protein
VLSSTTTSSTMSGIQASRRTSWGGSIDLQQIQEHQASTPRLGANGLLLGCQHHRVRTFLVANNFIWEWRPRASTTWACGQRLRHRRGSVAATRSTTTRCTHTNQVPPVRRQHGGSQRPRRRHHGRCHRPRKNVSSAARRGNPLRHPELGRHNVFPPSTTTDYFAQNVGRHGSHHPRDARRLAGRYRPGCQLQIGEPRTSCRRPTCILNTTAAPRGRELRRFPGGVTDDIDGDLRGVLPEMGADSQAVLAVACGGYTRRAVGSCDPAGLSGNCSP